MNVEGPHYLLLDIFGYEIKLSETIVIGWIIIAAVTVLILFLTHNMKKIPGKRQMFAEMLVTTITNLVKNTMGKKNVGFAPYMATIFIFSLFGSLISLLGLRPMTGDYNTTLTWAMMTFFMIQFFKIKTSGFLGYLKGFTEPIAFMTPLNLISEVATPISMSFRHFGNIAGGMVITMLLYFALSSISTAIGIAIPITTIGIPAVLSLYFDLFTAFMQAFIFIMLTMVFVGSATESE